MKNLIVILLEEAQNIFGILGAGSFLTNPLDDLIRRIRGRNVGMCIINQTCTTLSTALRSNVYTQFMLGATNSFERSEMGRSIGLENDQWEDAIKLDQPRAFFSIEGKKPRLIYIPKYNIISDSGILPRRINSPNEIPFVPIPDSLKDDIYKRIFLKQKASPKRTRKTHATLLLDKIKELLLKIAKRPFVKYTERKSLSFAKSKSDMFRVLNKAREMQLIRQVYVKTTRGRGQRGMYLELTAKGMDMLVENDLWKDRQPYYAGKSGFLHALIVNEVLVPYYKDKGYETHIEMDDCDLGLIDKDGNKAIAVELSVTTGAAHEAKGNVERNLANGWPRVVCVVVGVSQNHENIEESDIATLQKLKAFQNYFFENLPLIEFNRVKLLDLKHFRKAK